MLGMWRTEGLRKREKEREKTQGYGQQYGGCWEEGGGGGDGVNSRHKDGEHRVQCSDDVMWNHAP